MFRVQKKNRFYGQLVGPSETFIQSNNIPYISDTCRKETFLSITYSQTNLVFQLQPSYLFFPRVKHFRVSIRTHD